LVVGRALGGRRPIDSPAWLWLAGGACLLALPRAISYSAQHYQVYGMQAAQEEAFAWLDRNTPEDSVVAALSPQTGLRIPAYTHNKTAAAFSIPTISDLPPRENARRILYALSLFGTDLESYLKVAQEASADWSRRLWTGTMDLRSQERAGIFGWHFLLGPAQASALMRRAAQEAPLAYPVDYLWVGPFERSLIPASGLPGSAKLTQVFANSEIAIYKVP